MGENRYPSFEKLLTDFLYEEEANISRSKIIAVGTILALATVFLTTDVLAKHYSHSSHSSHGSHGSHGSHSSHTSGDYHRSHVSHVSHTSHTSSTDHSSHASSIGHTNHSSSVVGHSSNGSSVHASHASHGSAAVSHTSHASATHVSVGASHSNSGVSEFLPDLELSDGGLSGTITPDETLDNGRFPTSSPDIEEVLPEGFIDIRKTLIPPSSPSMTELDIPDGEV